MIEPDSPHADELAAQLRAARADSFAPGFADRVMSRLERESTAAAPVDLLQRKLQRHFLWLAPAALAATLLLGFLNMRAAGRTDVGAALGLPQVTLASAYSLDATAVLSNATP